MDATQSLKPQFVRIEPRMTAVVRGSVPVGEMIEFLDDAFTVLRAAADAAAIAPYGPQFSRYDSELEGSVDVAAGMSLIAQVDAPFEVSGLTIEPGELPGGEVARAEHVGPYAELAAAWQEFLAEIRAAGREPRKPYWEVYHLTPGPDADPNALRTELFAWLGE